MSLPKGIFLEIKDDVILWTNHTGAITEKQALEVSDKIKDLVSCKEFKALIVDNRKLKGIWKPEVDKVWIDLMTFLPSKVEKTATVCENIINKLQLNYLSIQAGTTDKVKAFVESEKDELNMFIELPQFELPKL